MTELHLGLGCFRVNYVHINLLLFVSRFLRTFSCPYSATGLLLSIFSCSLDAFLPYVCPDTLHADGASLVWMPAGCVVYVLAELHPGHRRFRINSLHILHLQRVSRRTALATARISHQDTIQLMLADLPNTIPV